MSFFRGQRFNIDLDSDPPSDDSDNGNEKDKGKDRGDGMPENTKSPSMNEPSESTSASTSKAHQRSNPRKTPEEAPMAKAMSTSLLSDVCERKPPSSSSLSVDIPLPSPPSLNRDSVGGPLATGFPAHRKRVRGSGSVFRHGAGQRRQGKVDSDNDEGEKKAERLGRVDGHDGSPSTKGGSMATGASQVLSSISSQLRRDERVKNNGNVCVHKDDGDRRQNMGMEGSRTNHGRGVDRPRQRSSSIDRENRAKLAVMSPIEIEQEREELMAQLSPAFVERLMKRVNIDSLHGDSIDGGDMGDDVAEFPDLRRGTCTKNFSKEQKNENKQVNVAPNAGSSVMATPQSASSKITTNKKTVSFASPPLPLPSPPAYDPDRPPSPNTLHRLYFPNQPPPDASPALSWTLPLSSSKNTAKQTSLSISALRFSLSGSLIPPSVATSLPVTLGLHHHAANPDVAGYTVAELTRLSRSVVQAQRCVAIKALGGIGKWFGEQMKIEKVGREGDDGKATRNDETNDNGTAGGNEDKRNGQGENGNERERNRSEDDDDEEEEEEEEEDNPRIALLKGLWALAKHERVLDVLRLAASTGGENENVNGGGEEKQEQSEQLKQYKYHQSVVVYAEDALRAWLDVERQMRVRRAV